MQRLLAGVLLMGMTLPAAADRKPWQWTDEERIRSRSDRAAAAARVKLAREDGLVGNPSGVPRDVIDGKRSPHLFMPTELFESVVIFGFVFPEARSHVDGYVTAAGLPPNFWEQLEPVVALYARDVAELFRLGKLPDQREAGARMRALRPQICRERADALRDARRLFGPALDVLMYRYMARQKSITVTHDEDGAFVLSQERGCR